MSGLRHQHQVGRVLSGPYLDTLEQDFWNGPQDLAFKYYDLKEGSKHLR